MDLKPKARSNPENNGLLLIRLAVGLLILMAGLQKALNPDQLAEFADAMTSINLPKEAVYVIFLFEIVGPLMLILGVLSRLAAGFTVAYLLIAIFAIDFDNLLVMVPGRGHVLESEFFFLLASLAICFLGSGDKAIYPD